MSGATLDLICFPGAPNLPIFAALQRGLFTAAGVEVRLQTTPSSTYQIEHLARGAFQIAGTAFDNVVAYREGQGAVALDELPDLVALMGATRIELALVVAPDIRIFDDLRGRSIALDALATGFAFVLYDMLERAGVPVDACELVAVGATPQRWESVKCGEHAGTLTIEPFTSIAVANGFGVLSSSRQTVPDYQGGCVRGQRRLGAATRRVGGARSSAATWRGWSGRWHRATTRPRRTCCWRTCPPSARVSPTRSWPSCSTPPPA